MLETASLAELQAVFDTRELDARGGFQKQTAIAFLECPDELIVWLVEQGLDVDARDDSGRTPLAVRALTAMPKPLAQIPLLLSLGADIEAPDQYGRTPLQNAAAGLRADAAEVLLAHGAAVEGPDWTPTSMLKKAIAGTENAWIPQAVKVSRLLIERGADPQGEEAFFRRQVERIGKSFEFHRGNFASDLYASTEAGLEELYEIFGVEPVARRVEHDGRSPIEVPSGRWQDQHEALWELLVPSSGPAATEQGEVIRISGRVADEMLRNGGANWGRDFRAMVDRFREFLAGGNALPALDLAELDALAGPLRDGTGETRILNRMAELGVAWVAANPEPRPLGEVGYAR